MRALIIRVKISKQLYPVVLDYPRRYLRVEKDLNGNIKALTLLRYKGKNEPLLFSLLVSNQIKSPPS